MNYNENTGQKLSPTIDLQSDNCKNYLKEKKRILLDLNGTLILVFAIFFAILYIFTIFVNYASADDTQDPFEPQHNAWFAEEQKIQKAIRLERLEVCKEALEASTLSKNEIYGQSLVIRCAAYATLVYAVESGFGTSTKCLVDYNCYGMKGNGIENPAGFLKFNSYREGTQYFTKKYFQWHYKKLIPDFVYGWSETDRNSYIEYMNTNFWQIYQELENLYFNN